MKLIDKIFKKKADVQESQPAQPVAHITNWAAFTTHLQKATGEFVEPWTLAIARLNGTANDRGIDGARRMYNAHKVQVQNQWINPLQSVNSGFGNAQWTAFLYQTVNYYECYALAQDPLFAKVFNILSETPFAKGGELILPDGSDLDKDELDVLAKKYGLWDAIKKAVKSSFVSGGCLVYMDFGLSQAELSQPLDLRKMNLRRFKGFRHIDPINCAALDVETLDCTSADYMKPRKWFVIGLGTVDRSHFLFFEQNQPELVMRPLTLYFGMPLTQLIKQDVANTNLVSQGVANLINRFRYTYLTADDSSFATNNAENFRARLDFMSMAQDNFGVCPLKTGETVQQLTTPLTGLAENLEMFYLLVSAKTDIPFTELMGKSAQGMDATGAGDRRKWYDRCVNIQESVKSQLLTMWGVIAGTESGNYVEFPDYVFNPLEESSERERAENMRSFAEVSRALIEMGADSKTVIEWLKSFKEFHLDGVEFDESVPDAEPYGDISDLLSENKE